MPQKGDDMTTLADYAGRSYTVRPGDHTGHRVTLEEADPPDRDALRATCSCGARWAMGLQQLALAFDLDEVLPTRALVPVGVLERAAACCDRLRTSPTGMPGETAGELDTLARALYAAARGEQVDWRPVGVIDRAHGADDVLARALVSAEDVWRRGIDAGHSFAPGQIVARVVLLDERIAVAAWSTHDGTAIVAAPFVHDLDTDAWIPRHARCWQRFGGCQAERDPLPEDFLPSRDLLRVLDEALRNNGTARRDPLAEASA
jgi:hypothetical protein